jgi:hypothetical protein
VTDTLSSPQLPPVEYVYAGPTSIVTGNCSIETHTKEQQMLLN